MLLFGLEIPAWLVVVWVGVGLMLFFAVLMDDGLKLEEGDGCVSLFVMLLVLVLLVTCWPFIVGGSWLSKGQKRK